MAVLEAERTALPAPVRDAVEEPEPYTSGDAATNAASPDLRTELTREGALNIMPPTLLFGEDVLPDFALRLESIFTA